MALAGKGWECVSLLLNRIKIRNKFSRSRYVKVTGGVSVDKGVAP